jgi:sulfide:quinone oxidoreductase
MGLAMVRAIAYQRGSGISREGYRPAMKIKQLTPEIAVAAQISTADIKDLAEAGFRTVISNRPDGEAPDQPENTALKAAAQEAGLAFRHIPAVSGQMTERDVEDLASALGEIETPALMFCRSGTRSTTLWALASAGKLDAARIVEAAAAAGYDLQGLRPELERRAAMKG